MSPPLLFFLKFINWRIIALQCCAGFCHTTWISHNYTYVSPLEPPSHHPIPLDCHRKIWNASWICISTLCRGHANHLCILVILVYYCQSKNILIFFIRSLITNPITVAFLVAQMVKNLPAMQETRVWSLGQEDSLEKGMVTHSSILA